MNRRKLFQTLISFCMLFVFVVGCIATTPALADAPIKNNSNSMTPAETDLTKRTAKRAASYDEVYKALSHALSQQSLYGGAMKGGATVDSGAAVPSASNGSEKSDSAVPTTAPDYSQTNVQVKGVDEGDIVKTDGSYIYVLRKNELIIFKADGAATTKVSSVKIIPENTADNSDTAQYTNEWVSDLYISGNLAVVTSSYSSYIPYTVNSATARTDSAKYGIIYGKNKQISKMYIYDITNKAAPIFKTTLGQDGYLLTTRLVGSTLYMISNYHVYNAQQSDSSSYIPSLYKDNTSRLVDAKAIAIMPESSTTYTVVGAYNIETGTIGDNQTLLGGGSNVYMNQNTLYIAGWTTDQQAGTPYTDSVYTVIDYTSTSITDLTSFDLTGGGLKFKASGAVLGSLDSQFNMDEYDGKLRIVTSTFSQSWSEYTDKAKGFVNYIWKDPITANALNVLDSNLKVIGSLNDLASGERVYSVRYDGPIGYIVTFRQVDPLFAVDLSDPTNPSVLSALKIPGFSEYLHVWGQGRLFGLGMDADATTGRTDGMKLAMFDTSNPKNVTLKHELKLSTNWSTALYNHKAILISPDKSLIAFPADNGYDIYTYSDEQGFTKRATISNVEWSGDSRGLYISNQAYIVDSTAITVLDMTNFTLINKITY